MGKLLGNGSTEHGHFSKELGMFLETEEATIVNDISDFTFISPYTPRNIYYMALKSEAFRYVSVHGYESSKTAIFVITILINSKISNLNEMQNGNQPLQRK